RYTPDQSAGRYAHERPDQHVATELGGNGHTPVHQDSRRLAVFESLDLAGENIDLEEPEDKIDQDDQPEGDGCIELHGDCLPGAYQPAHIEMLCPHPRYRDPVTVEPCCRLF